MVVETCARALQAYIVVFMVLHLVVYALVVARDTSTGNTAFKRRTMLATLLFSIVYAGLTPLIYGVFNAAC